MTIELQEIVKPAPFAHLKTRGARPTAKKVAEDKDDDKKEPEDEKDAKACPKVEDEDTDAKKAEDEKPEDKDDEKDEKGKKAKGKKKVKAEDDEKDDEKAEDKQEDDDDEKKEDARKAERSRIKSIMAHGGAQAEYLAYETDLSVEVALGILAKAPEAKKQGLSEKMETVPAATLIPGDPNAKAEDNLPTDPRAREIVLAGQWRRGKI
jgi:hypothetical protein